MRKITARGALTVVVAILCLVLVRPDGPLFSGSTASSASTLRCQPQPLATAPRINLPTLPTIPQPRIPCVSLPRITLPPIALPHRGSTTTTSSTSTSSTSTSTTTTTIPPVGTLDCTEANGGHSWDFGQVFLMHEGNPFDVECKVSGPDGASATVSSIAFSASPDDGSMFIPSGGDQCTGKTLTLPSLNLSDYCFITVRFVPTAGGAHSASLTVTSNGGSPVFTFSGEGLT